MINECGTEDFICDSLRRSLLKTGIPGSIEDIYSVSQPAHVCLSTGISRLQKLNVTVSHSTLGCHLIVLGENFDDEVQVASITSSIAAEFSGNNCQLIH